MTHVTKILDARGFESSRGIPGPAPYTAVCCCPWRSNPLSTRQAAANSADRHRVNAAVQGL